VREVVDNGLGIFHREEHTTATRNALFRPSLAQEALHLLAIRSPQLDELGWMSSHTRFSLS
jgi:hypothetical protein